MVIRPRLLVTLFRKCVEAVVLCGRLSMALVLPTRVTTAAVIVLWLFLFERADLASRWYHIRRACQRQYASPLSEVWVQTAARINELVPTLPE